MFKMLMKKGLLNAVRVKLLESWEHSGFNIDASVRIGADDATGWENLARYLIRAPFSGEKITYNANEGTVIYKTKRATGANGNLGVLTKVRAGCAMPATGWKRLLAGAPWFRGEGRYPIAAYSEFMPPPRLGRSPCGSLGRRLFSEGDPWGT